MVQCMFHMTLGVAITAAVSLLAFIFGLDFSIGKSFIVIAAVLVLLTPYIDAVYNAIWEHFF